MFLKCAEIKVHLDDNDKLRGVPHETEVLFCK